MRPGWRPSFASPSSTCSSCSRSGLWGKREFSELTPFDLVTSILIPDIVQEALIREDFSMTNALIALCTLFSLVFATSLVSHLSRRQETVIGGAPTVLVHQGRFIEDQMNRQRITPDEVYSELRKVGLERIEQVKWAILEPDSRISFIPASQEGTPERPSEGHISAG
ncbi:MAG TPA: YetF domain-containing protein [Longimicrobiales bacterium]